MGLLILGSSPWGYCHGSLRAPPPLLASSSLYVQYYNYICSALCSVYKTLLTQSRVIPSEVLGDSGGIITLILQKPKLFNELSQITAVGVGLPLAAITVFFYKASGPSLGGSLGLFP